MNTKDVYKGKKERRLGKGGGGGGGWGGGGRGCDQNAWAPNVKEFLQQKMKLLFSTNLKYHIFLCEHIRKTTPSVLSRGDL